jgi:uncharacterized protein YdhG (YjbR/CyaY superfamily)
MIETKHARNVNEYIACFPKATRARLQAVRKAVKESAPHAVEGLAYHMPVYRQNRILLYFAAHENHLGFYPLPSAIKAFKKEIKEYKSAKGSVQFPHDKPLPIALIKKMVRHRVKENMPK